MGLGAVGLVAAPGHQRYSYGAEQSRSLLPLAAAVAASPFWWLCPPVPGPLACLQFIEQPRHIEIQVGCQRGWQLLGALRLPAVQ